MFVTWLSVYVTWADLGECHVILVLYSWYVSVCVQMCVCVCVLHLHVICRLHAFVVVCAVSLHRVHSTEFRYMVAKMHRMP